MLGFFFENKEGSLGGFQATAKPEEQHELRVAERAIIIWCWLDRDEYASIRSNTGDKRFRG